MLPRALAKSSSYERLTHSLCFNFAVYTTGVEAEKTMVVPVSSDKGLCGGINSTVVKYSKVVCGLSEGSDKTSMTIVGEKAGVSCQKCMRAVKSVIVDLSKVPLTFATASLVTIPSSRKVRRSTRSLPTDSNL